MGVDGTRVGATRVECEENEVYERLERSERRELQLRLADGEGVQGEEFREKARSGESLPPYRREH